MHPNHFRNGFFLVALGLLGSRGDARPTQGNNFVELPTPPLLAVAWQSTAGGGQLLRADYAIDPSGRTAEAKAELLSNGTVVTRVWDDQQLILETGDPLLGIPNAHYQHTLSLHAVRGGDVWHESRVMGPWFNHPVRGLFQGQRAVAIPGTLCHLPGFPADAVYIYVSQYSGGTADTVLFLAPIVSRSANQSWSTAIRLKTDGHGTILQREVIARSGDLLSGAPGPIFNICDASMSSDGRVALCLQIAGFGTAVWAEGQTVLQSGDPSSLPGLPFSGFCQVSINSAGSIAVVGNLSDGRLVAAVDGDVLLDSTQAPAVVLRDPAVSVAEWDNIVSPVLDNRGVLHCVVTARGSLRRGLTEDSKVVVAPYASRLHGRTVKGAFVTNKVWVDPDAQGKKVLILLEGVAFPSDEMFTALPGSQSTPLCTGATTPTGGLTSAEAYGSRSASDGSLEVILSGLPAHASVLPFASLDFLTSTGAVGAGGGRCVGPTVRFGRQWSAQADGVVRFRLESDLLSPVLYRTLAGESVGVQALVRDGSHSSFTEAIRVDLQ